MTPHEKALEAAEKALTTEIDNPTEAGWVPVTVTAYLAAMEAEGWKMVPVEPTKEMLREGFDPFWMVHASKFVKNEPCGPIYKAMLAAAPKVGG